MRKYQALEHEMQIVIGKHENLLNAEQLDFEALNESFRDVVDVVAILGSIRKRYEEKFEVRMYANGDFENLNKETDA